MGDPYRTSAPVDLGPRPPCAHDLSSDNARSPGDTWVTYVDVRGIPVSVLAGGIAEGRLLVQGDYRPVAWSQSIPAAVDRHRDIMARWKPPADAG